MAYQRVDPHFFILRGFQTIEIQHQEMMVRAMGCHPSPAH
jgi:hypothetical protein